VGVTQVEPKTVLMTNYRLDMFTMSYRDTTDALRDWFGDIDIYLFDQLLKGRIDTGDRLLDAGCGGGRNLIYLVRSGYDVSAVDHVPEAIEQVINLASRLAPQLPQTNFRVEPVEAMSFDDGAFDFVISSAVLHFAKSQDHFIKMLEEMWRVLRMGGVFFARLASTIGIEDRVRPVGDGRFHLPDGSVRFLVDEEMLVGWSNRLGGDLLDPIKTTNVQNLRAMTTWVLRKR
jgi:tellurite methyltransferase